MELNPMKKLVLLLASFCLMTVASAAYKDGTYEGQGDGNHGKIDVSVVIKGGKIADIKVLKHTETDMIIQAPIDNMIPKSLRRTAPKALKPLPEQQTPPRVSLPVLTLLLPKLSNFC